MPTDATVLVDEMLAIRAEIDAWKERKASIQANVGYNELLYYGLEDGDESDKDYCEAPLYLWKWREGSICRKDPLYVPKTYTRMIYSNSWLVKDFLDRGMVEEARYYCAILIYGTYFMLNKPIWLDPMNAKYRYETEKCFSDYYLKHKDRRAGKESGRCCSPSGARRRILCKRYSTKSRMAL